MCCTCQLLYHRKNKQGFRKMPKGRRALKPQSRRNCWAASTLTHACLTYILAVLIGAAATDIHCLSSTHSLKTSSKNAASARAQLGLGRLPF
ncbi:hypothetical protein K443DRAFT_485217 [Laccaria amethystina LaAM-08-1]|uniref:Uncharacterized protein n=1 Tax=Laccaria amethystina LaAM-08-1 TaxID=1095629 RepID=A0A0C9XP31_9AGAR|nr:hypothetical protein K443DRAFT_485217 [Laccaria amethystina LaAM-08-1]